MPSVTLISSPEPYVVNFDQYDKKEETLSTLQKVGRVGVNTLKLTGSLFVAVGKAGWTTVSLSGKSFKYTVLQFSSRGQLLNPLQYPFLATKITIWMISLGYSFLSAAVRNLSKRERDDALLKLFADPGINLNHLKIDEVKIDVSHVPPSVKVENLLTLFDQIEFSDTTSPGYMKAEDPKKLKAQLKTFCKNINKRIAFIGTPPEGDTIRLLQFYQQIEDAVRFSLHKVTSELEQFKSRHAAPFVFESLSPEDQKKYKDLMENQGRLVLDLATAGAYCGARYMGESMSAYDHLRGSYTEGGATLEDGLVHLLAEKRMKLARSLVEKKEDGLDVHIWGAYMASMGPLVALEGSSGIIEHLASNKQLSADLRNFFDLYNTEGIIATIQAKVKSSQDFRDQIIDWIKDQVGEWCQADYQREGERVLREMGPLLDQELEKEAKIEAIGKILPELNSDTLNRLLDKKISLEEAVRNCLQQRRRDDFLAEIFSKGDYDVWDMKADGLKPELLEWILVSQGIFNPQVDKQQKPFTVEAAKANPFLNKVVQSARFDKFASIAGPVFVNWAQNPENYDTTWQEGEAQSILSLYFNPTSKAERFALTTPTHKQELLTRVFKSAMANNPAAILSLAEKTEIAGAPANYPRWKRVCFISLAGRVSAVMKNQFFSSVCVLTLSYYGFQVFSHAVRTGANLIQRYVVTLCTSSPLLLPTALRIGQIFKICLWCEIGVFSVVGLALAVSAAAYFLTKNPVVKSRANKVGEYSWKVIRTLGDPLVNMHALGMQCIETIYYNISGAHSYVGEKLEKISIRAQQEKERLEKERAYAIWMNAFNAA